MGSLDLLPSLLSEMAERQQLWHICQAMDTESKVMVGVKLALERREDVKADDFEGLRTAQERSDDLNGKGGLENRTGLMYAVIRKHYSVVQLLLDQPGLALDCQDSHGQTALHLACEAGDTEAARMLGLGTQTYTGLDIRDQWGRTPLMAASGSSGYTAIIGVLREANKRKVERRMWRGGGEKEVEVENKETSEDEIIEDKNNEDGAEEDNGEKQKTEMELVETMQRVQLGNTEQEVTQLSKPAIHQLENDKKERSQSKIK
eukprot:GFUD01057132.1.p1 GENE.GFUD01057132.1~~GFUD01057132.1.p1  ORF type:complete len:261 (+),score=87.91 GFUD01057132.1:169-951(+)